MSSFVLKHKGLIALKELPALVFVSTLKGKIAADPMLEPLYLQHNQQVSLSAVQAMHTFAVCEPMRLLAYPRTHSNDKWSQ